MTAVSVPAHVRAHAHTLSAEALPAYLYDTAGLRAHLARVRAALPSCVELFYATKANPHPAVVGAVGPFVDGYEVSSGGELEHISAITRRAALVFGGPGKTPEDIEAAVRLGVHRLHIESLQELDVVHHLARRHGRTVEVLLRANVEVDLPTGPGDAEVLVMGGRPTAFGLGPADLDEALRRHASGDHPHIRVRGIHTHLAGGLDAAAHLALAHAVAAHVADLEARHRIRLPEVVLGGGMAVDYARPDRRFDWQAYGDGLRNVLRRHPLHTLRIEPGRALAAYCGWYVTDVLDAKDSHDTPVAVVRGGTHHLRTPAAKGIDQPCAVLPREEWPHPWPRARTRDRGDGITLAGQLCTPKDVLTRSLTSPSLRAGDRVVFGLAGAYAWNISHHDFLMHPYPTFHVLDDGEPG